MSDDNPPVDHAIGDDEPATTPIEDHVKSRSTWLRLVFMLVFCLLGSIATMVTSVIVALGFFWVLFTGEPNRQLQRTGKGIAAYLFQIVSYLTYNSDTRPFPFDDEWPSADD